MFYITFHKKESNIWAYDDNGNLHTTTLLATPSCAPTLAELRGMTFGPNGYLYVANGYKQANQVLVYSGSSGSGSSGAYSFIGVYANPAASPGVAHPFAIAFDSSGNGYVSSQDTNVVTAFAKPPAGAACDSTPPPAAYPVASPLAVATYLNTYQQSLPAGTAPFLPGTFVASVYGALNGVTPAPPNVPQPAPAGGMQYPLGQGLQIEPATGPASHSVRDVVVIGDLLYVADEPGNAVKIYRLTSGSTQGELQGTIQDASLTGPVHLLVNNGSLYISSSNSVLAYNLTSSTPTTFLSGLSSPAGMAFDSASNFYYADRTGQLIYQSAYNSSTNTYATPTVFIPSYDRKQAPDGLQDEPEFIVYVNSAS
jgi:hypothetical protein